MSDPKDPSTPAVPAEEPKRKKESLIELRFEGPIYSGELVIGDESFAVVDGAVKVPERVLAGAWIAGFR